VFPQKKFYVIPGMFISMCTKMFVERIWFCDCFPEEVCSGEVNPLHPALKQTIQYVVA
jgi:hypothetical protein